MISQPDDTLEQARLDAGLTKLELWIRYFALGGLSSPTELDGYLLGALRPSVHEHNLVAHALNERFLELGGDHPVPYAEGEQSEPH